ncbi:MAG: hypothetical protein CMI52_01435 [Parcubacteria group bacterium]|nr:hypothetical protein [Parcubacteria group bacterium]
MEILKELLKVISLIVALVIFGVMFADVVKALALTIMILAFGGFLLLGIIGFFMEISHADNCVGCGICIREDEI